MKILQINKLYYPVIGGIETVVKDIAEGLNNHDDVIVDVMTCQIKGKRTSEIIEGVRTYKAASFGKVFGMPISFDFFRLFFQLKNDYDLFVIHYPFPLSAFLTLFIPKKKIIIFYHSDIVRQKFSIIPFLPIINYSLGKAKKIIVTGRNIINSSSALIKYKDKCGVVPLGVNVNFTYSDYVDAVKIKEKYVQKVLLLGIGRLVYYKGFEYAIRSMSDIDASLFIVGTGPEERKLRTLIEELGLKNKVSIISPQKRLEPFLLAADIFVFPSTERSEAFGLVQLEAMAAGKPVINTYLKTAVEEVSLGGVTGLTVECKNPKALSSAINILVNNESIRKEYGKNAQERYRKLFTLKVFLKNFKEVIFN